MEAFMEEDIKRYQIIKSLNELPVRKIYARPMHIRTYWRKDNDFFVEKIILTVGKALKESEIEDAKSRHNNIEEYFGLTQKELFSVLIELYGGQQGYYVVDLKNRQYFHCKNYEDMEVKLEELGCKPVEY
ncbi:hypothetical protein G7B40_019125 [Aetokthonos hydrillicola Thurmond2011]|jgi:hypothetical protein|uniref:Uncharacterized protein n=1 Tax=Aetokthonos hydrillicola Thurmond2011 TaxID=2712845 RepID=A0AAP5M8X2_9CYAN|nr:hypothetical protein [Aetokthonos hydrillicola]MDR9896660.1 hypothetical protein [Aetokthonos hydrillicola Thurmond2011]